MSEPAWDEKAFLRAEKYSEALQNENEGLHFWIWRRELAQDTLAVEDDDWDDEDGPPEGWTARKLN